MLRLTALACALIASATCAARPMIIRESQAVKPPPGSGYTYFGYVTGIDGDWAIVTAGPSSSSPTDPPNGHDALLYHRVNGQWTLDRTLIRRVGSDETQWTGFGWVAMSNGVAAIGSNPIQIFKRTNSTWTEIVHPFAAPPGDPDYASGQLVWDGRRLLAARPCDIYQQRPWGALVSRLNTDGSWSPLERISSGDVYCEQTPSHWGICGNTVVAGALSNDYETYGPDQLHIFRRSGTSWTETSTIDGGEGEGDVRGNEIFVAAPNRTHALVYRNDDSKTVIDKIGAVSGGTLYGSNSYGFKHTSDVFVQHDDLFRKNAAGKYEHVAKLVPSDTYYMDGGVSISGRRVISQANSGTSANQAVLFFDLPQTFTPSAVVATGFESGVSPFNPQLGSFAVATTANGNHVYRQSSLTGDYRVLLGSSDWIEQSIEADIKPTAFSGTDRWAGLAVRYLDDSNYYYVTLRSSGVVQLKRMRNGVPELFLQKGLPIVAGRSYRVSLQAYVNGFVVRVDGKEFLYWNEEQRIPHGNVALVGYRTAVDYDNVVAAEVGQRPIVDAWLWSYNCYGRLANSSAWTLTGTGTWSCESSTGESVVQQTSITGNARALIGLPTDDQVVTTRARMTNVSGQDRWFGIAARYVDASNYYYLTLRTSNTVSLRKVVNGAVTVLGTASRPVAANTWYDLRLDAVGNELRAFVNGVQVLQAVDTSLASGQNGLLTYKSAVEYKNYFAWQP